MSVFSFDIQSKFMYYCFIEKVVKIIVIGKKIIKLESIDSTNDYIKKHSDALDEGTIVQSSIQTLGRGRSNHSWMSKEGNLYFSFLLNGYIPRNKIFELLIKVSNAIICLLKDYNIKGKIKYPNDILVEDKKICGILIESYGSKEIDYVVVGIGININQVDFMELSEVATSMKNLLSIDTDINQVLEKFIKYFNSYEDTPFNKLFNDYLRYSLIIGKRTKINGKTYLIKGINESGKLIIENNNNIEYINLNEISIKDLY